MEGREFDPEAEGLEYDFEAQIIAIADIAQYEKDKLYLNAISDFEYLNESHFNRKHVYLCLAEETISHFDEMIKIFVESEEYEKCSLLNTWKSELDFLKNI